MVAALDDAALFQNHDAVTVLDSRKSVGDDESGSSFHQLIHAVLYNFLHDCLLKIQQKDG